jgi:RNA polymerase sigma-70 factor (ECF subfamily)
LGREPEPPSSASAPGAETAPGPGEARRLTREELERVKARDPEALAALFEVHFDRIYGLIHRLLGERSLAEDVTQEVFYKVQRAAHRIDPARDPGAWLVSIAYNACRDVWRSSAHRMGRRSGSIDADPVLSSRLEARDGNPADQFEAEERRRLVVEAISRLPDPLRSAIVLHDYAGLSHQEIAAMTGTEHAAARKRYSRALVQLGASLKESLR